MDLMLKVRALLADQDMYINHALQYQEALIQLAQNRLPTYLVPPILLSRTLKVLERAVKREIPGYTLLYDRFETSYYYTHDIVTSAAVGNELMIHLSVPASPDDTILDFITLKLIPYHFMAHCNKRKMLRMVM
jgi:hypothetical protein